MADPTIVAALFSGGLAGLVTAGIGYLAVRRKIRQELKAKIDFDLRGHRIGAYKELWEKTRPLSESAGDEQRNCSTSDISDDLATWYFENGGLFLSETSQMAYRVMQLSLMKHRSIGLTELSSKAYKQLRQDASRLRTCTSRDVGSREEWESSYGREQVNEVRQRLEELQSKGAMDEGV